MAIGKPEMLLMLVVAAWAATTGPAAATRPEDELLSWTPAAPNGLSLRPADTPDGSSLLSWWLGFKTAHIEESSSGTTFTQNPFVATVPPMPATTTSAPGTLDHVKHLAITVPINVSSTGRKLSYAVRMSAKVRTPGMGASEHQLLILLILLIPLLLLMLCACVSGTGKLFSALVRSSYAVRMLPGTAPEIANYQSSICTTKLCTNYSPSSVSVIGRTPDFSFADDTSQRIAVQRY
ncbi:hypothetical protein Vretifemale_6962 [Volvox reticuliferus]|nr:hypothetical protein Vretifemale_6962 [Volvox reticuliferus]